MNAAVTIKNAETNETIIVQERKIAKSRGKFYATVCKRKYEVNETDEGWVGYATIVEVNGSTNTLGCLRPVR